MTRELITLDANEAAAYVAHKTNEVIAIYPITPSSAMGEWADQWSAEGRKNIWGSVPVVVEMQAEGGAAGAVHGALQAGSLTTTFTASQGLLLMIPNMYKIAGELTSAVFHIAARSLAAQALSIFGDHSDVMAARSAGWAMLFGNSVQEVHDFALITQAATLKSRIPFLDVFDGFRTSHEIGKIEILDDETIRAMIDDDLVTAHRERALTPDHPFVRGMAQNPDVYFQGRETVNRFYDAVPGIVQATMDQFAELTGRQYHLFDYVGAPDAERVIVLMGSGAEAAHEAVEFMVAKGEKVGLVKVRLYRPFAGTAFLEALPASVKKISVLDRTKEPGASGEPLYQDVLTAAAEAGKSFVITGGRYGLSSKEFTPAMVKGVFDELAKPAPKNHFTIGIIDDVTNTSLSYDPKWTSEADDVVRAVFWGLGSDGTVGANKNSIKIIGEETDLEAQGYFVYDSKKSGARTISHLRFGPRKIRSTYLIQEASFVAVHVFGFLEQYDVLETARPGATFLLNSPYPPEEVWAKLPRRIQEQIIDKKLNFYMIDAYELAKKLDLGTRINTIMQTCFFYISGVLPQDEAIAQIKKAIKKTYGKRGQAVVDANNAAVDASIAHLFKIEVPATATSTIAIPEPVPSFAPAFVKEVTAEIIAGRGDLLPVSKMPIDGTYPSGTTQYEKRNLALAVPAWDPETCIQCGKCSMVCPHAVIRAKVYPEGALAGAPQAFKFTDAKFKELKDAGYKYTIQVAVEDCTGCGLCVENCPAKNKTVAGMKAINMVDQLPIREQERANWDFFMSLPDFPRTSGVEFANVKNVQLLRPLFEFSGACAGCGETPYIKLVTQLFGDRALIANATGCSSIYSGNLPTTPYAYNADGRGPAWSNSLFEDNAEFGLGMYLSVNKQKQFALEQVAALRDVIGADLADAILNADQSDEAGINAQRDRVAELKAMLAGVEAAKTLLPVADYLVKKVVWIFGGDGWAYDIGYGGLDHVLASDKNVNVLVLDTEVYSNTGGQSSKATPLGAVAKFAAGGKATPKKDLGMIAMTYGYVYVAQVALGGSDAQLIKALREAESYDGPSLVIAYSHCINHGIDMTKGLQQQELAVKTGYWPLYRFDPRRAEQGLNPLQLDSKEPSVPLVDYLYNETRFKMLQMSKPDVAKAFAVEAQDWVNKRFAKYQGLSAE